MKRTLLICVALWVLGAVLPATAQNTITVADGTTTNGYVPIYGYYCDSYLKSEYVIPAADLAAMTGCAITSLTWYPSTTADPNWTWGNVHFQVFLKEIDSTTLSAYSGPTGGEIVYEGTIAHTSETMVITFDTPYVYNGGNLLVGVYNTEKGDYKSCSFYGVTTEGASVQGYNATALADVTANQRNFIPKTTFTYLAEGAVVVTRPKLFVAEVTSPNSATLTWMAGGDETQWDVAYKADADADWIQTTVNTTRLELTDLEAGTAYTAQVRANKGADAVSSWATTTFITPFCNAEDMGTVSYQLTDSYGDGWNGGSIKVIDPNGNELASLTISSGLEASGSFNVCYGVTYQLVWARGNYSDEVGYTFTDEEGVVIAQRTAGTEHPVGLITEFTINPITCSRPTSFDVGEITYHSATLTWSAGTTDQTSWEVAITDSPDADPNDVAPLFQVDRVPELEITTLNENTTYYAYVRGLCDADDVSAWTEALEFTTPEQYSRPTAIEISDITSNTAVVSFETEAPKANIRYLMNELSQSFEEGLPATWAAIDNDGDGNNWQFINPSVTFAGYGLEAKDGNMVAMSRSYNGDILTPDNWLITEKVKLGGDLKYWIMDDGQYPENYRIYVSTTDTNIDSFIAATDDIQSPGSLEWVEQTIDMSRFAGMEGYIAFRHYSCTNQDFMFIDAVRVNGDRANWIDVEGVTSPHQLTGLNPGAGYDVQVQADYGNGALSAWTDAVEFSTLSATLPPYDIEINDITSHEASVSWNGVQESYNLRYRTAEVINGYLWDFEDRNQLEDWLAYDADGDGNNWYYSSNDQIISHSPISVMTSASYASGILYPDNWLITPVVELKGTLSFWASGQDADYPAEHFAVYAAVGDWASLDDFKLLSDTIEATGEMTEYSFDLSQFAGQTGCIAFRHFDCSDMFRLNIDDVWVSYGADTPAGEWVTANNATSPYALSGLAAGTRYEVQVQGNLPEMGRGAATDWAASVFFTTEPGAKGDINGDDAIDGNDVSALLEMVLSGGVNDAQKAAADITGDNSVDGNDVSALLEMVLSGE